MQYKVLLADDSLTIQKVIKITLANEPYQIIECNSEKELLNKISSDKVKLVFLDFTLSDENSGYDLAKKIKKASPTSKILMMFGTFDTIDEAQLKAAGVSDKIVKPFDSTKFINICRNLIADDQLDTPVDLMDLSSEEIPEKIEVKAQGNEFKKEFDKFDELDEWTVDAPVNEVESIPEVIEELPKPKNTKNQSALDQSMEDWGMEVPSVIGQDNDVDALPPIINNNVSATPQEIAEMNQDNIKFDSIDDFQIPDQNDLEYPDMDNINESTEDNLKSLEEQIADEDAGDLWSADEIQVKQDKKSVVAEKKVEKPVIEDIIIPDDLPEDDIPAPIEEDLSEFDQPVYEDIKFESKKPAAKKEVATPIQTQAVQIDYDKITQDIMKKIEVEIDRLVTKKVEFILNTKFSDATEKVAWDVIPELAENLIRDELKKISSQILND